MIGVKEFSLMKPGSILINTSRGGIVDEAAMVQAVQERRLGAVGLDVFEEEPLDKNNPILRFENVLVTPHSAGLTSAVLRDLSVTVCKGVIQVLQGERPDNVFNPVVFK